LFRADARTSLPDTDAFIEPYLQVLDDFAKRSRSS